MKIRVYKEDLIDSCRRIWCISLSEEFIYYEWDSEQKTITHYFTDPNKNRVVKEKQNLYEYDYFKILLPRTEREIKLEELLNH